MMAEPGQIFTALKARCPEHWDAYVRHDFVRALGAGSLPEACFRHYLGQDYIFLIHFARAYALAAFKSDELDDMRSAAATLGALIDSEMALHHFELALLADGPDKLTILKNLSALDR